MPTDPILNLEALSRPISEDFPAGEDLREDSSPSSVYYQIKDVRSQARAAERQTEMGDDSVVPDWRPILQIAPKTLEKSSKDYEIAAYLLEAMVRLFGFAGMRDGCRLIEMLAREYGEIIYPLPDEDGLETRLAPLTGLNGEDAPGTLVVPLRNVPLTAQTSVGAFGLAQYEQAVELERLDESTRERRISQGAVDLATFQIAVAETDTQYLINLREDLQQAIEAFAAMTAALDERYGRDSPPSSKIRQALSEALETLEKVGRDKFPGSVAEEVTESEAETAAAGAGGTTKAVATNVNSVEGIRSREDAFRILTQVADYFLKSEPHSPISYSLQQIVRWGRLPLPELMKELISDESSVHQMFRLVGIRDENND